MRIAYFDCSSGISGDMVLAAFIDAGLSVSFLKEELKKLKIKNWKLRIKNVTKKNLPAKQVIIESKKIFSSSEEMVTTLHKSSLSNRIKNKSAEILNNLISSERKVHRLQASSSAHLHELASVDTLIDIISSCIALEKFELEKIYASAVNIGSAAPVTLQILHNLPVYKDVTNEELTTPTGAAILASLVSNFGEMPLMKIEKAGFGAGEKEIVNKPNLLRLFIGETIEIYEKDKVILLETNIDDMNPQLYPYVTEKLFKTGAYDVWLTPIQMKKGRPGIVLSCILPVDKKNDVVDLIFRETTSLGVRITPWERIKLPRRISKNSSGLTCKIAQGAGFTKKKIEYEEAKKIAQKKNIPLKEFYRGG